MKKVILLRENKRKERYFVSVNENEVDTTYNMFDAVDLSNKTENEINSILEDITKKPFNNNIEVFVIDIKEYESEDFKIKQALNKLSNEEILLLGLEEIGFYHLLKNHDKENMEFDINDDVSEDCGYDYDELTYNTRDIHEISSNKSKKSKKVIH